MRKSDLICGLFWLSLGMLITFWSMDYAVGSIVSPGPGFLPLVLGILLMLLSIILLKEFIKDGLIKNTGPASLPADWKKIGYTISILLAATFLFETLGYFITIFLLMLLLMLVAELKSWKKILLIAVFSTFGVHLVFVVLLEQPLPVGFLRL
jgi:hypothetical protein